MKNFYFLSFALKNWGHLALWALVGSVLVFIFLLRPWRCEIGGEAHCYTVYQGKDGDYFLGMSSDGVPFQNNPDVVLYYVYHGVKITPSPSKRKDSDN